MDSEARNPNEMSDDEFLEDVLRKAEEDTARELAATKKEALARGKEPFDLDKFSTLYDFTYGLSSEQIRANWEQYRKEYERSYFLTHRDVMTIEEFADAKYELDVWDGA